MTFSGNTPAMVFNNFLTYGQPHSRALIRRGPPVKPLKGLEDFIQKYFIKSDAVVFYMDLLKGSAD